ncbi:MAG: ABC transporter permease [Verrucomicrobiota bacterium]
MVEIPLARLALILLPILVVGLIARRWTGRRDEYAYATLRMLGQLLGIGYVLVLLFRIENPWMATGVVLFMIAMSSWIGVRTVKKLRWSAFCDAVFAIGLGGGVVLVLVLFGVLGADPWYKPRVLIPLAGMTFSNAMTAVTLAAERFEAEKVVGKPIEESRNLAWNAALIPQINGFLAVGLVSLPGMMTGQILAGASPLDAVRYQIMVMGLVLGAAGLAVAIFLTRMVGKEVGPSGENSSQIGA